MPFSRQKIGRIAAYTAAFTIPVAITYLVAALRLPPFVFEHLIVLLEVGVAITWGGWTDHSGAGAIGRNRV